MGVLFIVATPLGNLQDITIRAVRTLFQVDTIACEDTRRTGVLLQALRPLYEKLTHVEDRALKKPKLLSYFEQNELRRIPEITSLLHNDEHVALVSDAGMPAISDPGYKLIRECIREGIKVEVIPGPSSPLVALVASGMPTDKFTFLGYPPAKSGHRKTFYANLKSAHEFIKSTYILFEAPHKIIKTLEEMKSSFGDIEITLARELTKIHEEVKKQKISEFLNHFEKINPKGEFVIVFAL